ncbi:MAG: hypothetical protein ACL7BU_13440 [Candidatus Phlomobacter fragariae]
MSTCWPVVLVLWGFDAIAEFLASATFSQSYKSKASSTCGFKATEQWIAEQQDCDWQHITFTMPHLLWPFFNDNWL